MINHPELRIFVARPETEDHPGGSCTLYGQPEPMGGKRR